MALSIPIVSEFDGTGIKKAIAEFKQLEGITAKSQFALKKAVLPATAALAGLATAANSAVKSASDLGESVNAVKVTFGQAANEILKLSDAAAVSVGLSKKDFNALAVQFSSFATKIAGKSGNVAEVLKNITNRAADFASVMNIDVAEAAAKFQSGLAGEAEPLKKFGIDISDAAIKAYALANNIGIVTKKNVQLSEAEKVLARYGAIMQQTEKTAGDFARTSDGLANSQRILSAKIENLKSTLGQSLLPVIEKVLPQLQKMSDWASENPQVFTNVAIAIGGIAAATVAVNAAMAVNPYVAIAAGITAIVVALEKLFRQVDKMSKIGGLAARLFGQFALPGANFFTGKIVKDVFGDNKNKTPTPILSGADISKLNDWSEGVKKITPVTDAASKATGKLGDTLKTKLADAVKTAKDAVSTIKDKIAAFTDGLKTTVEGWASLTGAVDTATSSEQAYTNALKERAAAYDEMNMALATGDMKAYADALNRVGTAEANVADAQKNRKSYTQVFAEQIAAAKSFAGNLSKLAGMGLGAAGIQQLLDLGPVAGASVAQDLLSGIGGLTVSGLNQSLAELGVVGAGLGAQVAGGIYGSDLTTAQTNLSAIRGARTSGNTVYINVNGGDPEQVVSALRRYMQVNGSVPIRVTNK